MLERFFTSPDDLDRLRQGALSEVLDDVATLLYDESYSPGVARSYLLIAGHFSRWLDLEGSGPTGCHADLTARFRDEHLPLCRCPKPRGMRVHVGPALGHVLDAMKNRGWRLQLPVSPPCPVDRILRAFDTHLDHTCGAAPATRRLYARYARGFLDSRFGAGEVDLRALKPRPLIDFISEQARDCSPERAKVIRTALRSLFRLAEVAGLCEEALAAAVPRVARWKWAQLPRALSDQQLAILRKAFDHSTIIGRRDYVITLGPAQLGLRAGEAAALTLDDIDWRSATLQVARGKERRASLLPLPAPLGRALADYLRKDRPPTQKRQLFVRNQAPLGVPLTSSAVTAVVRRAFARADLGVAFQGAHVLRHATAMHLLQSGVDLTVIALWLGHESPATTHQYLEADLAMKERALRSLQEPGTKRQRFRPTDRLLAFLDGL